MLDHAQRSTPLCEDVKNWHRSSWRESEGLLSHNIRNFDEVRSPMISRAWKRFRRKSVHHSKNQEGGVKWWFIANPWSTAIDGIFIIHFQQEDTQLHEVRERMRLITASTAQKGNCFLTLAEELLCTVTLCRIWRHHCGTSTTSEVGTNVCPGEIIQGADHKNEPGCAHGSWWVRKVRMERFAA